MSGDPYPGDCVRSERKKGRLIFALPTHLAKSVVGYDPPFHGGAPLVCIDEDLLCWMFKKYGFMELAERLLEIERKQR